METTTPKHQQSARIAIVRAIPIPPHKRRWCGSEVWADDGEGGKVRRPGRHALPWSETEVKVAIVDNPAPFDPTANGGAPIEISPKTLTMLEQDPRITVRLLGGDGGDPAEIVRAKAQLAEQEEAVTKARRELSEMHETAAADQVRYQAVLQSTEKRAVQMGIRVSELEAEVATLRAQLADKKTPPVKK